MFVRWQQYRSQALSSLLRERNDQRARLKAILVEAYRVDGKPKQRHIAFLGSISIDKGDAPRFQHTVTACLDRLSNRVSPDDRQRIEAALVAKVGLKLLTPAELDQHRTRLREECGVEL
jgi:hypothetical protein